MSLHQDTTVSRRTILLRWLDSETGKEGPSDQEESGGDWLHTHHSYPSFARQGFCWREPDPTYDLLRVFQILGLIRDASLFEARVLNPHPIPSLTETTGEKAV